MDKTAFRNEFLQRFAKNGKLKDNISPYMIVRFVTNWISDHDPQQEVLDYIREQNSIVSNILNYIAQNTSPCVGLSPCSDELIKARGLDRDSIVPYLFKPLEDYFTKSDCKSC